MSLDIDAQWERLESGLPEERATFAAIGILVDGGSLTEAEDSFVKRVRQSVHLSAYRLAEWLAWNWWRLRWEPRGAKRSDWAFAHRLATIGGGYVWPNLTVFSDGERVALLAKPTARRPAEPLRYLADRAVMLGAASFESALDRFLEQVRGQLRLEEVGATNLDEIWDEVLAERGDPTASRWRQLEACLGYDPGEAPDDRIEALLADEAFLGRQAASELAAATPEGGQAATAAELRDLAKARGVELRPAHAVRLDGRKSLRPSAEVPAWRSGVEAARALRAQEALGAEPLPNSRLAALSGVAVRALEEGEGAQMSFALEDERAVRVVLRRTCWQTARRFDLGRLLGDRLLRTDGDRLFPATRAYTYRQKWQRAFAAELLCPSEALIDMLAGDFSDESLEQAAQHFSVSELAVRTTLVNHGLLVPEDLESVAGAA